MSSQIRAAGIASALRGLGLSLPSHSNDDEDDKNDEFEAIEGRGRKIRVVYGEKTSQRGLQIYGSGATMRSELLL